MLRTVMRGATAPLRPILWVSGLDHWQIGHVHVPRPAHPRTAPQCVGPDPLTIAPAVLFFVALFAVPVGDGEDGVRLTVDGVPPAAPDALVAVRPEFIRLSAGAGVTGRTQSVRQRGRAGGISRPAHRVSVARNGGVPLVAVRHGDDSLLERGATVIAQWEGRRNSVVSDDP
jgi:hypothetical protein